jgi:hypothetical protein
MRSVDGKLASLQRERQRIILVGPKEKGDNDNGKPSGTAGRV